MVESKNQIWWEIWAQTEESRKERRLINFEESLRICKSGLLERWIVGKIAQREKDSDAKGKEEEGVCGLYYREMEKKSVKVVANETTPLSYLAFILF